MLSDLFGNQATQGSARLQSPQTTFAIRRVAYFIRFNIIKVVSLTFPAGREVDGI